MGGLADVEWADDRKISFTCPKHQCAGTGKKFGDTWALRCEQGCGSDELRPYLEASLSGSLPTHEAAGGNSAAPEPAGGAPHVKDIASWKIDLFHRAKAVLEKDKNYQWFDRETAIEPLTIQLRETANGAAADFGWSASELEEELDKIAHAVAETLYPENLLAKREEKPAFVIPWESYSLAIEANEEYLKREAVIDKLCYRHAVSMITGGKHAGKSTLARWIAICVAKGWEVLGRSVNQGKVFYIASEDETMAARQELLRLGWKPDDPIAFLPRSKIPDFNDPRQFLGYLTEAIKEQKVSLVVLDMLFDFVRIADEMSYAGTREAVGHIQDVASESGAHIIAIHHAPKHAQIGDAAVAALGSQGLAARVSPIILVRRFGQGVHSVSSTSVRDPRGEAVPESRLVRNPDGSVELGGAWKNYMLAEVYSERVLELLGAEEGSEMTASDISEALDISYQVAKSTLSLLFRQQLISRDGPGKKGKPFRYSAISQGNGQIGENPNSVSGTSSGSVPNTESAPGPDQGRFGYKE